MEVGSNCGYDYVSVTYEDQTTKHCGTTPPPSRLYEGPVTVTFHSDDRITRTGFRIIYEIAEDNNDNYSKS